LNVLARKTAVATLSVFSNTVLVVLKIIVGLAIGSVSVISEAIHSGVDLLAAVIALIAVRTSGKPADREHQYGHGKIENISGTIEALLIFLAAAWIIYEAVRKLMHPEPLDSTAWGIVVMGVSSVVNIVVSGMLFKVGKETDSVALQADAWHLRTDVWTSFGVMIGLASIWVGKLFWPSADLHWIDPVAAIFVAMLILKAAWELTVQSMRDLLDASLPKEEQAWVVQYLNSLAGDVRGYHALRTRKAGPYRFIECHMLVTPDMSVEASHAITDEITANIQNHFGTARVLVHVEPDDGTRFRVTAATDAPSTPSTKE
jgi:cation diffusion facilitator family transporter